MQKVTNHEFKNLKYLAAASSVKHDTPAYVCKS